MLAHLAILTVTGSALAQAPASSAPSARGAAPASSAAPLPALPPPAGAPGYGPPPGAYAPPPGYPQQPGYPAPPGYAPQPGYPPGYPPPPGYGATSPTPDGAPAQPSSGYAARAAPAPALPIEMRYVQGRPIPAGYHVETRARRGLVITGPILFGVPYVFSLSSAASSTYTPDRWLYLPVLGPFIDLASRGDRCTRSSSGFSSPGVTFTSENCTDDGAARFFLMFDGLMQTAGATMLILGLALPQHLLVRDDAPFSSDGWTLAWTVRPQRLGRHAYGLGVDGTF